jgi:hypothetical protein
MPSPRNARLTALKRAASHLPKAGKRLGLSMRELKVKAASTPHSPAAAARSHAATLARFRKQG